MEVSCQALVSWPCLVLDGLEHALAPLKTKASRRTIPVGEWVLTDIAAHLDQFGPGPQQLVMSTALGGFVHRYAFGDLRQFSPRR
jgi:hypothetical protein